MFSKYLIVLVATVCFCTAFSYAQNDRNNWQVDPSTIEYLVESLMKDEESELDLSEIEERLNYYLRNPINLNTASEADQANLFFLSRIHSRSISAHRYRCGV